MSQLTDIRETFRPKSLTQQPIHTKSFSSHLIHNLKTSYTGIHLQARNREYRKLQTLLIHLEGNVLLPTPSDLEVLGETQVASP